MSINFREGFIAGNNLEMKEEQSIRTQYALEITIIKLGNLIRSSYLIRKV